MDETYGEDMKKKLKSIRVGQLRESMMLLSGYCLGLSCRTEDNLTDSDRKALKESSNAMIAACKELWPEWFNET